MVGSQEKQLEDATFAPPAFNALDTGDIRGRHLRLHLCSILDPRGVQVAKVYKARVMTAIGPLANDRAIGVGGFAVGTRRVMGGARWINGTKCRYFCRYRGISY
jgi:hypothetical protein